MNTKAIKSLTVSLPTGDLATFTPHGKGLEVKSGSLRIFPGCNDLQSEAVKARFKLATWIATLPHDNQLDTLEQIRDTARFLCPACVSEKGTLDLYPYTVIKI